MKLICSNAEYDGYFDAETNEIIIVESGAEVKTKNEKVRMDIMGDVKQESLAAFIPICLAAARGRIEGELVENTDADVSVGGDVEVSLDG